MIKGLAITPPVLGRISIGKVVKKMASDCLKRMTSLLLLARFKIKMVGLNIHWMSSFGKRHKMENSVPFLYG